MSRTFRSFLVVLAGVVLGAVVLAPPGSTPQAKAALGPVQSVTLAAADFHPAFDQVDVSNQGWWLYANGTLMARIPFPAETVVLTSVKARVYDNVAAGDVCVRLARGVPGAPGVDALGTRCTDGASSDNPQTLSITAFKRVGGYHAAYLEVEFDTKHLDLNLYGVTVFYRAVT
jgi:hypothetical protein